MTPDLFFAAAFALFIIRLNNVAYQVIPGWLNHLTGADHVFLLVVLGYCLLFAARLVVYLAKHVRWEP